MTDAGQKLVEAALEARKQVNAIIGRLEHLEAERDYSKPRDARNTWILMGASLVNAAAWLCWLIWFLLR